MTEFLKYGSIENLTRRSDILRYECVATEKIHGTSWIGTVGRMGEILLGSRNNVTYSEGIMHGKHQGSVMWFLKQEEIIELISRLYPDYVFYGEWAGPGIQKGVTYSKEKDLYIYDVKDPEGKYLDSDTAVFIAEAVGFRTVPEIMRGKLTVEMLNDKLDQVSALGIENEVEAEDNTQEGFVIKPLQVMYDHRGNRVIAKYKSAKWAEKASMKKSGGNIDPEKVERRNKALEYAKTVVTLGRITTIVDHIIRDSDNEELSMKRTGEFLKEMQKDVEEDEKEFFATLDKETRKVYIKAVGTVASQEWRDYIFNL